MLNQKLQHPSIHTQTAHPVQQHQGGHTPRGKVDRPTLRPLCDQEGEGWEFFRYECVNYKASMGIIGGSVSSLVQGAGSWWKSLRRTSRSPTQAADLTEVTLIAAVKKLAVREESKLAHRIMVFLFLEQPQSTRIHEQGEGGQ